MVRGDKAAGAHRLAYVLPGQGGQRPGMGALFYGSVPLPRRVDRCDELFGELFGESPLAYLLGTGDVGDGTTVVQSALFMQMVALGVMWRSVGIDADAVSATVKARLPAPTCRGK